MGALPENRHKLHWLFVGTLVAAILGSLPLKAHANCSEIFTEGSSFDQDFSSRALSNVLALHSASDPTDNGIYELPFNNSNWAISRSVPYDIKELRTDPLTGGNQVVPKTATVRVLFSRPGRYGGRINYIFRFGSSWISSYRFKGEAIQGDPRNLVAMTSPAVGYFLGFGRVGFNEMTAPDAKELMNGLRFLNDSLAKIGEYAVPVSFIETSGAELGSNKSFVVNWAYHGQIPIADGGPAYFHDLGYHVNGIILPREFVLQSQLKFRRIIEFIDYAKKLAETDSSLSWFGERWESMIYSDLADQLDSGSGNFWTGYVKRFNRSQSFSSRQAIADLQRTMMKMGGLTRSADSSLLQYFRLEVPAWEKHLSIVTLGQRWPDWKKVNGIDESQFQKMEELVKAFLHDNPSETYSKPILFYQGEPDTTQQALALLKAIDARRLALSRASMKLFSDVR